MNFEELNYHNIRMNADNETHTFMCVQLSVEPREETVTLASVIGPQTAVKSFAAALNQPKAVDFTMSDLDSWSYSERRILSTPDEDSLYVPFKMRKEKGQGKYKCRMHRLEFSVFQCTAMLKDADFMPMLDDNALYNLLTSPAYTTPMLRSWIPAVKRELFKKRRLKFHPSFQCTPGSLWVGDSELDRIVCKLIRAGKISVED